MEEEEEKKSSLGKIREVGGGIGSGGGKGVRRGKKRYSCSLEAAPPTRKLTA